MLNDRKLSGKRNQAAVKSCTRFFQDNTGKKVGTQGVCVAMYLMVNSRKPIVSLHDGRRAGRVFYEEADQAQSTGIIKSVPARWQQQLILSPLANLVDMLKKPFSDQPATCPDAGLISSGFILSSRQSAAAAGVFSVILQKVQ